MYQQRLGRGFRVVSVLLSFSSYSLKNESSTSSRAWRGKRGVFASRQTECCFCVGFCVSQTINTYKVFLKDAVQLLGATSLEATKFAEEVFHFEKRIAELTPNTEDIINPVKSIQILNVADLQRQSFSVKLVVPSPHRRHHQQLVIRFSDSLARDSAGHLPDDRFRRLYRTIDHIPRLPQRHFFHRLLVRQEVFPSSSQCTSRFFKNIYFASVFLIPLKHTQQLPDVEAGAQLSTLSVARVLGSPGYT